jgi:hypothetical protein
VKRVLLAAALVTTAAIAIPVIARSADAETQQAQAAPMGEHGGDEGRGGEHWMRGREGGWPMMRHRMMREDPQEWCLDRLARRAARRAYVEVKLNLTPEQRPLWDKVQNAAQTEEQQERQLCSSLKPGVEQNLLTRMDRMQQFLTVRLNALQAEKPAVQALYQALTPEQRAIVDHPFRR